MKPRVAETLKGFGCEASVEEFRQTLTDVKAEHFPQFTDEELTYARDEAGTYCSLVRKRLNAPRLIRPFILRALVGLKKNKPKTGKAATLATQPPGIASRSERRWAAATMDA
jgi:hypothetical protein